MQAFTIIGVFLFSVLISFWVAPRQVNVAGFFGGKTEDRWPATALDARVQSGDDLDICTLINERSHFWVLLWKHRRVGICCLLPARS